MRYMIDQSVELVSEAMLFAHVQRNLTSMLNDPPVGVSGARMIEAALQQLTARLAYERSPEVAVRHLSVTTRLLKDGGLRM